MVVSFVLMCSLSTRFPISLPYINVTPSAEGMSRERCEWFFVSASTKFQLTEEIRVENESTREDHIMDLEQLRYLPARRGRHLELPISR